MPITSTCFTGSMTTDFVYMAFPKRTFDGSASYGFDGNSIQLFSTAYVCPRCYNRTSEIPTQCCVCKVQLNSSSHIARSHHHLFPVPNFNELNLVESPTDKKRFHAYRLNDTPPEKELGIKKPTSDDDPKPDTGIVVEDDLRKKVEQQDLIGVITHCKGCLEEFNSTSLAMHCPSCDHVFCIECDLFIHNSLHNCPGCI
jgi:transcription initiation factor TFIIH subunit 2